MLKQLLTNAALANQIELNDIVCQKILRYIELIQRWNKVFNLTSITDPEEMIHLHIIDSLIINPLVQGSRLLDVGSGAGLPGIPLAILNPTQQWTLLDKNGKKTRFLTQAIAELKLTNAVAVHSRCEDFHPSQCFDSILSRAFATVRTFVESTEHLLCPHGFFLAMKGKYPTEELADLPSRFMTQNVTRLRLKGLDIERHLVCLKREE